MEPVISLMKDLVQTDTTLGKSEAGASILKEFFEANGISAKMDRYQKGESNVIASIGPKEAPSIIISGHIDTVPFGNVEDWRYHPLSAEIVDGIMWGRGTVDMKGGTSALAHSLVDMVQLEDELKYKIVFAGTGQEEVGLLGAKVLEKQGLMHDAEFLIIGEPTELEPKSFEKGIIWFDIHARGKQAHASRPDLGNNAIEAIGRLMPKIKEILPEHSIPEVGRTTINFGKVVGGTAYNVVAEEATLSCDIRTTPGVDNNDVIGRVKDLLDSIDDGIQYSFHFVQEDKAVQSLGQEFPNLVKKITEEITGRTVEIGGTYYATDAAALMANKDLPFVIFGPGSTKLLHQTNEHCPIDQVVQARKIYTRILKQVNGIN